MKQSILLFFCLLAIGGCASPGPKYLNLSYSQDHDAVRKGKIVGLARFSDKRISAEKGYVGNRRLLNNSKETFVVTGQDLSATLTSVVRTYLEKNGFIVKTASAWPRTPDAVAGYAGKFDQLLTADINRFECRAAKTGATTEMKLEMDLTFYQGVPNARQLKTIPVALNMERTELTFSLAKLEELMNDSLAEILRKALPL